jgi:hypothetical protein
VKLGTSVPATLALLGDYLHCCANYYRHLPMNPHYTKQAGDIQGKSNFFWTLTVTDLTTDRHRGYDEFCREGVKIIYDLGMGRRQNI